MLRIWAAMQSRFTDDKGATLVEYALLLVLIAIIAIAALTALGGEVSNSLTDVEECLADTTKCPTTTAGS